MAYGAYSFFSPQQGALDSSLGMQQYNAQDQMGIPMGQPQQGSGMNMPNLGDMMRQAQKNTPVGQTNLPAPQGIPQDADAYLASKGITQPPSQQQQLAQMLMAQYPLPNFGSKGGMQF